MLETLPAVSDTTNPCNLGEVDVVVVLYRSGDSIEQALKSVPEPANFWLVENLPEDGSVNAALRARPQANILRPQKNLGFGAACNLAIRQGKSPWILLLNPDAHLDQGCLERMIVSMAANPNIAAVGPLVLRSDDGTIDSAGMDVLAPGWAVDRMRGCPREDAPLTGLVDALSGGVLLLRREALAHCDRLPDAFWGDLFLYNEDVELSLALRKAGWSLLFLREAVAHHEVGGSGGCRKFIRAMACRNRIVTGLVHADRRALVNPKVWCLWGWRALMDWPRMLNNLRIPELRKTLPGLILQIRARRRECHQRRREMLRNIRNRLVD